jgi:hypothetical protein
MNLIELYEEANPAIDPDLAGLYDIEDDTRKYNIQDTRKPSVTLRQINKLRKYNEFRKQQDKERENVVSVVYAVPAEGEMPMQVAR